MVIVRKLIVLTSAVSALAFAGCGGGADESKTTTDAEASGDKPVTVKVGLLPIEGLEPFFIAKQRGFFEQEGIRVEPQMAQGGAAIIPGVVSGELQLGFSNNVSLLLASEKGLPLRVVADADVGPRKSQRENVGYSLVVSKKGSPIREAKDLAGKKLAVNTLNNIGPVLIDEALERRGVDPSTVKYTEVPFPDMISALDSGAVDAAWLVQPFSSLAESQGANVLIKPYVEVMPGRSIASYFTTASYAEQHPGVVEGFKRALRKGTAYATSHPAAARAVVPTYTKIPADVAKGMVLSVFAWQVDPADFDYLGGLMRKSGLVDSPPDVDPLLSDAN